MNTDSQHLQQVSEEFQHMVEEFFLVQSRYSAAIKEIQTKLEILDGKKKIYTTDSNYSIRSDISCVSIAYDPDHFYCAGKGME